MQYVYTHHYVSAIHHTYSITFAEQSKCMSCLGFLSGTWEKMDILCTLIILCVGLCEMGCVMGK